MDIARYEMRRRFSEMTVVDMGSTKLIYIADQTANYAAMNSNWNDWVASGHAPARATTGAKLIHPAYRAEIEAVAAIKA